MQLSVVIGAWNRPQHLRLALKSLELQDASQAVFEILVIDNSAGEEIKAVCDAFTSTLPHLRHKRLAVRSGNLARNRGMEMARGTYLAFLDDDAIAQPEWVTSIINAFEQWGPRAGCLGGPSFLIFERKRPLWLSPWLEPFLGAMNRGEAQKELTSQEMIFGLNIAFRTAALQEVGGYLQTLDRGTQNLLSNSEYPMQTALEAKGYKRYYIPQMRVGHHATADRLTMRWMLKRAYWQGVSDARWRSARLLPFQRLGNAHWKLLPLLPTPANAFLLAAACSMLMGFVRERLSSSVNA